MIVPAAEFLKSTISSSTILADAKIRYLKIIYIRIENGISGDEYTLTSVAMFVFPSTGVID
jgi:hypothetical protein